MPKIAILTDSNSGITQSEGKEMGIRVIPMPFRIDGVDYFEDINLTQEEFYKKLKEGGDISTSQPSPKYVTDIWDELLKEYDQIVYIPMSSGLSSSCQTALMLADDYDGKVEVVNNQRISVTQRSSVRDAMLLAKKGLNAKEIKDKLEADKFYSSIYITLDTLYYLKKGGRITPAAAAIGTLLKIKPVLQIQGEKLDEFAKARTVAQAKTLMINAIKNDREGRVSGNGKYKTVLQIAHTENLGAAKVFAGELKDAFPDVDDIEINALSLSVSCHIGPGALAVAVSRVETE
ncbi:MAG: DegV family protein [Lachnospiraceae bacterium]|nr:DegV family protein [Lachnospiraceae bacterium]